MRTCITQGQAQVAAWLAENPRMRLVADRKIRCETYSADEET
jgi:hypothetical protein